MQAKTIQNYVDIIEGRCKFSPCVFKHECPKNANVQLEKDIKDLSGKLLALEAILRSKDQQIDEILMNIIELGKA